MIRVKGLQEVLGARVRGVLEAHGIVSVAAPGFQAPGVVVSHTHSPEIQSGKAFMEAGLQIANGVPLKVCACVCVCVCVCERERKRERER